MTVSEHEGCTQHTQATLRYTQLEQCPAIHNDEPCNRIFAVSATLKLQIYPTCSVIGDNVTSSTKGHKNSFSKGPLPLYTRHRATECVLNGVFRVVQ
jgi:hypothetical protein